jgi:hypothetical protein
LYTFSWKSLANTTNGTYTVTASTVQIPGYPTITYTGASSLLLMAGKGTDTINVEGTTAAASVTVMAGPGSTSVNVAPTSQDLSNLGSLLIIDGGGATALIIHDSYGSPPMVPLNATITSESFAYNLTDQQISRSAFVGYTAPGPIPNQNEIASFNTVSYTGIRTLEVDGSNLGATFRVLGFDGMPGVKVVGGGKDTLMINDQQGTGGIAVPVNATVTSHSVSYNVTAQQVTRWASVAYTLPGPIPGGGGASNVSSVSYAGIGSLELDGSNLGATYAGFGSSIPTVVRGGAGDDVFQMIAPATAALGSLTIDGGGGTNTLNYSGYQGNVLVDLPLGTATGIAGGIRNIQNVRGGQGNNILVGNGGNTLIGGTGRNLLIAGPTASTLVGNSGEDILVGGTTDYDLNSLALEALMAEWSRADRSYGARVQDLLAGAGLNGSTVLDVATFRSNGGNNILTGGDGLDLFYGLLPSTSNTPDKTDWNPAQGEIFVTPKGEEVPITLDPTGLGGPSLTLDGTQPVSTSSSHLLTLQPGGHYLYGPGGTGRASAHSVTFRQDLTLAP